MKALYAAIVSLKASLDLSWIWEDSLLGRVLPSESPCLSCVWYWKQGRVCPWPQSPLILEKVRSCLSISNLFLRLDSIAYPGLPGVLPTPDSLVCLLEYSERQLPHEPVHLSPSSFSSSAIYTCDKWTFLVSSLSEGLQSQQAVEEGQGREEPCNAWHSVLRST